MRTLLYPLLALCLFGTDWPQLRGPNGSGLCPSCGRLPIEFGPQRNVLWKTELPVGKSSPVLVGDRIFLTASEGDDLITICLSRITGKVQWRRSIPGRRPPGRPMERASLFSSLISACSLMILRVNRDGSCRSDHLTVNTGW